MVVAISIIIVNFNTGQLLRKCLSSIREYITVPYEVIVVDNASTDDSILECQEFISDSRFRFVLLEENLGFAAGNNRGVAEAIQLGNGDGKIFHFLNPDTEVTAQINSDYLLVTEHPEKVYVNPLINPDGSLENSRKVIPTLKNIFYWNFCRSKAQYWCLGASVIISNAVFEKIGGWCEDYFMYAEDMDLFYNIWISGIEIEHLMAPICHLKGGSSRSVWSDLEREAAVQRSFRKFYRKHFSKGQYVAVKLYFLMHDMLRHPSKTSKNIKAWKMASKDNW